MGLRTGPSALYLLQMSIRLFVKQFPVPPKWISPCTVEPMPKQIFGFYGPSSDCRLVRCFSKRGPPEIEVNGLVYLPAFTSHRCSPRTYPVQLQIGCGKTKGLHGVSGMCGGECFSAQLVTWHIDGTGVSGVINHRGGAPLFMQRRDDRNRKEY